MFKNVLTVGFRSRKNNSFFFIRRLNLKNSTIYFQQTSAALTGERLKSTRNSRTKFIANKLGKLAAKKVFSFFNKNLNLVKKTNPGYTLLFKNFNSTLRGFFAHQSEKLKFFRRFKYPTPIYLIDKFKPVNLKNNNFLNLSNIRLKSRKHKYRRFRRRSRKYKFFKFLNFSFLKNLKNSKRIYFFIKLRYSKVLTKKYKNINFKVDYFSFSNVNNVVSSTNLRFFNNKIIKELFLTRELKLRSLNVQYLITSKNYRQKKFEKIFWRTFLSIINKDYYLPFKNVKSRNFKYRKWFKAKRFVNNNKKYLKQPLLLKLVFSYKLSHNGLRKRKTRRL